MINKFEYPNLERVDTDIGRHYLDSDNKPVPSVTTVLSGTLAWEPKKSINERFLASCLTVS